MTRKIKYGKIAVVIFLTCLIWVWADLAKTEEFSVSNAMISIAKSTNPNLWVSFNTKSSVPVNKIVFKGSTSKIAEAARRLNEGSLVLEFFLVPEQQGMTVQGEHSLDVLHFLRQSEQIRQLGLTVESCKPSMYSVSVIELVKKSLEVKCVDKDRNPVKTKTIDPPKVDMFVPKDWEGSNLVAMVSLADGERTQAKSSAVEKTPYIELAPGQIKLAQMGVKITMPPEEEILQVYNIKSATIGFVLSPVLQGKYKVELLNQPDMAMVSIKATDVAKNEYEKQPYQILLYILDGDEKTTDEQKRKVVYNFPDEFVRNNEIELNKQPVEARFKLMPLLEQAPP